MAGRADSRALCMAPFFITQIIEMDLNLYQAYAEVATYSDLMVRTSNATWLQTRFDFAVLESQSCDYYFILF